MSERNTCRALVGKSKGNDNFRDLGVYGAGVVLKGGVLIEIGWEGLI